MIVILGDSHTVGYVQAAAASDRADQFSGGPLANGRQLAVPFANYADGGVSFKDAQVSSRFRTIVGTSIQSADDMLAGRLVLSMGMDAGTFLKDLSAGWHGLGNVPAKKDGQYLSAALLADMMNAAIAPALQFYDHCYNRGWLVGAIPGPPIQERFSAHAVFGPEAQRVWSEFQSPVEGWLKERGVPVIRPIGVTEGQSGFLAQRFWGKDATHGNVEYGAAVIDAVAQCLLTEQSDQ